jgi:gamma-glutamyl-gamma-aminobutyrate hydrolase PuuD
VIEAIERPASTFCLGVQWHPENFWRTGEFAPLFEQFVDATKRTSRPAARHDDLEGHKDHKAS